MTRVARGPIVKKQKVEKSTPWKVTIIENKALEFEKAASSKSKKKVVDDGSTVLQEKPTAKKNATGSSKKVRKPKQFPVNQVADGKKTENVEKSTAEVTDEEKLKHEWKSLKRTQKRQENRQRAVVDKRVCFNCRLPGHTLAECPTANDTDKNPQCYKCGSTEHRAVRCKVKVPPAQYPFAKCFICCEIGHIAGQCPDNPKGVYPNGGCCKLCESVEHLAKDCPTHLRKLGIQNKVLSKIRRDKNVEADSDEESDPKPTKQKRTKLATF